MYSLSLSLVSLFPFSSYSLLPILSENNTKGNLILLVLFPPSPISFYYYVTFSLGSCFTNTHPILLGTTIHYVLGEGEVCTAHPSDSIIIVYRPFANFSFFLSCILFSPLSLSPPPPPGGSRLNPNYSQTPPRRIHKLVSVPRLQHMTYDIQSDITYRTTGEGNRYSDYVCIPKMPNASYANRT